MRGDFWVFGYGSLMWRPGFDFVEQRPARLNGAHRALCVYSHFHRGSADRPGLVLGLDRGGSCRGVAFRVKPSLKEKTVAYLREREQVTSVYLERTRLVDLLDGDEGRVSALCYLVDRGHPQYTGAMTADAQLDMIRRGFGRSGANPDYVIATVDAMKGMGIRDRRLEWLAARLQPATPAALTPRGAGKSG